MAAPKRNPARPARWLVALGGLAAAALAVVALLDFGDPMQEARDQLERSARSQVGLIQDAWDNQRRNVADPAQPAGVAADLGTPIELAAAPEPTGQAPSRLFAVLLDGALAAAAAGDPEAATERAADALRRAPNDPRATEAHLHLTRWASARGDDEGVRRHRADLLASPAAQLPLAGTSASLLATLVEPADPQGAWDLLSQNQASLPAPRDAVLVLPSGQVRIQWDPWWKQFHDRLQAAAPKLDWGAALQRPARSATALRAFLGDSISATEDRWTLVAQGGALFATRSFPRGVRVLAVTPDGLSSRLRQRQDAGPFELRFDHEPELETPAVLDRGREWLADTSIGFTLHQADPLRAGRAQAWRLRMLRAGLLALAAAILGASILAARAMQRAKRLAKLRSTFVASVSHDLRTPIQSILLMSETLERGHVARESSRARYFKTIRQEAQRLRRFVEDILDGARIDHGDGARVERRAVDMAAFVADLEESMRERAERDAANLTLIQGAMPKTLSLDPDGVHRAIWNLFENALRHGHAEGESPKVRVEFAHDQGVLSVSVHDQGPGISARFAETVFQPFERVRDHAASSDMQNDTGTGLGLAIVRAITRAHGGDTVLVPASAGARFEATFQTPDPQEPATEGAA